MATGSEGHRERLRERFQRSGLDAFHDHEVLEMLLSYAIPRRDVKLIAKALLDEFGTFAAVLDAPFPVLARFRGLGLYSATLISMLPRVLDRYQQDRWKQKIEIQSTQHAVSYLSAKLGTERQEVFCLLALNSKNDLVADEPVQKGSVNRTAVFPRLVAETALKHRATAVILAHNHPGGDPTPSAADRQLTRRLKKILSELDIVVHDHIIIAGSGYYSFAEQGTLE